MGVDVPVISSMRWGHFGRPRINVLDPPTILSVQGHTRNIVALESYTRIQHREYARLSQNQGLHLELSSLSVDRFARESLHKRYEIPKLFILIWCQKYQTYKIHVFIFFLCKSFMMIRIKSQWTFTYKDKYY